MLGFEKMKSVPVARNRSSYVDDFKYVKWPVSMLIQLLRVWVGTNRYPINK